jgi:serine/threonine protein kinase
MSSGPPTEQGQSTLARGATIGRYVVLGLVGRGGMGEVYAAYDPELDRKVAVKLLRVKPGAGVSQAEGRARTLREAQAIARLSHPNVVVVYDVGTFRDKVFIAMEFVDGNTATYWVESQARSWNEVLKVFISAGRGLAAAHEKGLVHRDFKPDNVMVGKDHTVRVMDFGLARQVLGGERTTPPERTAEAQAPRDGRRSTLGRGVTPPKLPTLGAAGVAGDGATEHHQPVAIAEHAAKPPPKPPVDPMTTVVLNMPANGTPDDANSPGLAAFDVQLTRTGAMMGTPAYMAPEQFLGTPTDARTDQFSFCIALYEALYGERPFAGNTMFTLTSNVVQGNVREAPANSKVPLWVRKILLRGLRPQANDRWPSMEDLIEALGKNPADTWKKWARVAAIPVVLAGIALWIHQSRADSRSVCSGGPTKLEGIWELRAPGEAESERQAQIHKAFLATGKGYAADVYATVSRALTKYVQSWATMHREACEATTVRKEQTGEVMDLRMACLQERLGGVRALTDVFADANGDVVENAVSASNALASLDRCADVPLLRAVVRPPEDAATRARVDDLRSGLAGLKAQFDAGKWKEVMRAAPRFVEDARKLNYQPLVAETLALFGMVSLKSDDAAGAEKAYVDAFFAADVSRHDEVRADVAANLVYVVGYQEGHYQDAERWGRIAGAVLDRLGGHQLSRAWLLNDLGAVRYAEGRRDAAIDLMEQALHLKEKTLGTDHPDVGTSEGNVAIALAELGRYQEALLHVQRSLSLLRHGLGDAHPDTAIQLSNRGEILNALGRPTDARSSFEEARIIWEREVGPDSRSVAYALTGIGTSYLAESNPSNALVPLERAARIRKASETDPAKRAETNFALARALWDSNRDRGRARALAEQARTEYERANSKAKMAPVEAWLRARDSG